MESCGGFDPKKNSAVGVIMRGRRGRGRGRRTKVIRKRNCTIIIKPRRRSYRHRW